MAGALEMRRVVMIKKKAQPLGCALLQMNKRYLYDFQCLVFHILCETAL